MKWYLILTLITGEIEVVNFSSKNACNVAANTWQMDLLKKGVKKKDFSAICVKRT